jgi:HEAT repeat protein
MRLHTWIAIIPMTQALLWAADLDQLQKLFDSKLTPTQRANVCFELRGNADPEVLRAMSQKMDDPQLVSCAAENLRLAHAVEALEEALRSTNEQTRAAAARELGSFHDAALIEPLSIAAQDPNILVASSALMALSKFDDPAVIPYLGALAKNGGMIGDMALERILQLDSQQAVSIARQLLRSPQVPDKLYAMRAIGIAGDLSDLPALKKIAASREETPAQRMRGFGLMPPINLARAAQSAMEAIEGRIRP